MKEIRVLVLSHMYPRSTDLISGIFVHQQIKSLLKEGCQVRVVSPVPYAPRVFWTNQRRRAYGQTPRVDLLEGISVYHPRYICLPGSWFHGISSYTLYQTAAKTMDSIVSDFQPHILHAYAATPDGYTGLMLKKKYKLPLICSLLGSDINVYPSYFPLTMSLTRRVISEADRLIAVSQALKTAAEVMARFSHEAQIIYMGCDTGKFLDSEEARRSIRAILGIAPGTIVLLFVGSLVKAKGVFDLMDAFAQLCTHYENLYLIFVGEGPARDELKRRITKQQFEDKVRLMGKKSHREIPRWLSASDIFVLPSHHEGLPNVVVEAMACSRPVVATRVGGIPEVVEDGESGILVGKGDVKALAKAIALLVKDESKRRSMGGKGRQIVEEKFTWERSARALCKVYNKVLSNA